MLEVEDPGDCADALMALALAAGAPDNVTCIIGDVVDLDATPSAVGRDVTTEIVGSAARDRHRPSVGSDSAAGRAAKLTDSTAEVDAEQSQRTWWERARPWLLPLAALGVLLLGAWGAYAWTQTQYFVGVNGDNVAIYRGIPQSLGPLELQTLVETSDVSLEDLEPYEQERIEAAIRTSSLDDARDIVTALEDGV
jgi:protein phosphatase